MTDVLIADDSLLLREGLAAVLREEGFGVVGKVATAAALRLTLATATPDVALVGVPMPPAGHDDELTATERMKIAHPHVGLLVLSDDLDPALALRLISRRPVSMGYMLKHPLPDVATLVRAVGAVAGGGTFVDRSVIGRLRSARYRPASLERLSERERGVLALMAEGRANAGICDALRLSPKTVETHVRSIFNKLDLRAAPGDHRRVLAALRYLQVQATGAEQRRGAPQAAGESPRPPAPGEYAA